MAPTQARRAPRWLKSVAATLAGLVLLAVLATSALWWWAGTDGSLGTGLRWVAQYQPLTATGASGSLRAGGHVQGLTWQQSGVTVEASDLTLVWQPWSLLHGTLRLNRLSAATVHIDDQRPPSAVPSLPPTALGLPLRIALDDFSIGQLQWSGPPAGAVSAISGDYHYTGLQHELTLASAQFASGHYQGKATLASALPMQLNAVFSGTLQTPVPGRSTALPLAFSASAQGPLTELAVQAALQLQTKAATSGATAANPVGAPHASATARIAPWAAQAVLQADADFQALNIALLWPDAPQTRLTGSVRVRPAAAASTGTATTPAWSLQTQLVNELPGPLNQQRLPLESLQASGEWRNGTAIVRTLTARIAGGTLLASGEWTDDQSKPATGIPRERQAARQPWSLQATLQHINPAALHTQLAAVPVNGRAMVSSQGAAIAFDASVQSATAHAATRPAPSRTGQPDLLRLRDASATGSWHADQASAKLVLSTFRIRSQDAVLSGSLQVQIKERSGQGKIVFSAPGIDAQLQGELHPATGAGTLEVQARDASKAWGWLQHLPGMPVPAQGSAAAGQASLMLHWQGGWHNPGLQAKLDLPALDWRASTAKTTAQPNAPAPAASALKLRGVEVTVSGQLSQAQLNVKGQLEAHDRRYALQLSADGGRVGTGRHDTLESWRASSWQAVVRQLAVSLEDPTLGDAAWRLSTQGDVSLRWTPGAAGAAFEAGAGQAVLSAPPSAGQLTPARVQWQPVRWSRGELGSAGKITGLPLAWLALIVGPQMAGAGLTGKLVFDGAWDAVWGDALRIKASLARSSGDIMVQAEAAQGAAVNVAAGVREARLSLESRSEGQGQALTLALRWDSERAGTAAGQLTTRLNRDPAGGWMWSPDAPLSGQLRARLPRIGVWSVLAPPGWRLRGTLGANLALSGTRAAPQLVGELNANDLALRSVVDGIEFGNGRLRAELDGTRMRIQEFTLQGAGSKNTGGTLTAQGEAAWINGKPQVQLDAKLDRLRASIRTDRQLTLSGDLQARLADGLTQFTGNLQVDQARIVLPDEDTPQLGDDVLVRGSAGAVSGPPAPTPASASKTAATPLAQDERRVKLSVQIDLGQDFRIQGKGIDTRVRGALALTGDSLAAPRLVGTLNTVGGQYRAYGQRLDVAQGVLRFSGAVDNPALDILAIRPNLTQRVGVQITGTALLPRVRLYAQPELPDAEKLSWLVLGRASSSGGAESALLQQAALALLGSKSGGLSGGLAAALGLDELSLRGASNNSNGTTTDGAVTLGKRFSRNFYAAYERSISGAVGTLFVFYDLSQRFTVRAQAGQQSAVDLIYTLPYD